MRIKGRLDLAQKFIVVIYNFSFLVEGFIWAKDLIQKKKFENGDDKIGPFDLTSSILYSIAVETIWVVLYIFVYEMKMSETILRSKDVKELNRRQKNVKKSRVIILSMTLPLLVCFMVVMILITSKKDDCDGTEVLQLIDYVLRIFKIFIDLYMIVAFLMMYIFFF